MSPQTVQPKLAKPGAGLPFVEWAAANYILLPKLFKETSKEKALANFSTESEKILQLVATVDPKLLAEKRLVPRLRGLEDSSRYWSIAMTLQHLIIVSDLMLQAVIELSKGNTSLPRVGTADVKPEAEIDPVKVVEDFRVLSEKFMKEAAAADINAYPEATHPHPWFGPLTAHKWLVMAGTHENIHRQQIKAIIGLL
jgi:hypothetical protein